MTNDERTELLDRVQATLLPNLNQQVDEWRSKYDSDDDPELYFYDLIAALRDFGEEFQKNTDSAEHIANALTYIDEVIEELRSEYPEISEEENFITRREQDESGSSSRSIFDDVNL